MYKSVDDFMKHVTSRSPGEDEFHQAVHEVFSSIWEFLNDHPQYFHAGILDRIVEPERGNYVSSSLARRSGYGSSESWLSCRI